MPRRSTGVVLLLLAAGLWLAPVPALAGVITDGDLRRHMMSARDIRTLSAADVMTADPIAAAGDMLAVEALRIMEQHKITALVIVNDRREVAGVLHLHSLWRTEMF